MGDIKPNYIIEKRRLELDVASQKLSIQRFELRLLELEDEKEKIYINIESLKSSIKDTQTKADTITM